MIPSLELTILRGIVTNESYTRKVLPYVKDVYFETSVSRTLFQQCSEYFVEYGDCPTRAALSVAVERLEGVNEDEFRSINETLPLLFEDATEENIDFLVDATESWCKERAVYLALLEAISIHDGRDKEKSRDSMYLDVMQIFIHQCLIT